MKDISIIIPTFNNVEYLDECLNSVLEAGKNKNIEILVGIDNCEKTFNYVNSKNWDNSIVFYYFENNVGPYVVKNSLISESGSDKIIFFDSDDVMCDNMIDYIFDNLNTYRFVRPKMFEFIDVITESMKLGEHACGVIGIDKNLFLEYNGYEPWPCGADSEFLNRMSKNNITCFKSENELMYRRIHNSSLTKKDETSLLSPLRAEQIKKIAMKSFKGQFGPLDKINVGNFKKIIK